MSRVALVTGGMGGLGEAVCIKLAALGYKVVTTYSPGSTKVEGWLKSTRELGFDFKAYACDVSDYEQVMETIAQAEKAYGGLDLFFLNAGISTGFGLGADFDLAGYRRAMGINVDGVVYGVHAALPVLARRGGGSIVCTASVVNVSGFMEMMILQNTRLHLVYELAELVADSFALLDTKLAAETTRTTISFTPRSI